MLGLAWAPMLWLRAGSPSSFKPWVAQGLAGVLMVVGLTGAAMAVHALPLGIQDAPQHALGWFAMSGMVVLYGCLIMLQVLPERLRIWRRWSYAGFYVDEAYTRLALAIWPVQWVRQSHPHFATPVPSQPLAKAPL